MEPDGQRDVGWSQHGRPTQGKDVTDGVCVCVCVCVCVRKVRIIKERNRCMRFAGLPCDFITHTISLSLYQLLCVCACMRACVRAHASHCELM